MNTNTIPDTVRMSHSQDPHTSKEAAEKVVTKKELLYGAILWILDGAPMTPEEVLGVYRLARHTDVLWVGGVDLYDFRRRMSELQYDGRIEPIQVGTHRDGSPQFMTREGQRVMRLVES